MMEVGISREKSKRRGFRESLGLKKPKEESEPTPDGRLVSLFSGYSDIDKYSESESKIAKVREHLESASCTLFEDKDIKFVLKTDYANGNADKAFNLLMLLEESETGRLREYSPSTKLLGAVNRNKVTCYLDATLFAMFARLEDFEAMLYHTFDDAPRKRLVTIIRLWVNALRSGQLITADITKQLQDSLAECGWKEAALVQQQDASEAFGFITDVLELPRLTLKKDMFHQGKADQDDHKYTNERTIDVAIPDPKSDRSKITLEECLENYFDERVFVDRQREGIARRNTVGSSPAPLKRLESNSEKAKGLHIEVSELSTSNPSTPIDGLPSYMDSRPQLTDVGRIPSIFQERKEEKELEAGAVERTLSPARKSSLPSAASRRHPPIIGRMVRMPAFQFFRLIPWYTEGNPNSDLQVAQHFESKRPTVGICLKRFSQNKDGTFRKRSDKIDIPLESGIPSFLHDDDLSAENFPYWKFKLSLRAIICHRGSSINSGHYISVVRGKRPADGKYSMQGSESIKEGDDPWLLFDDLATPRVQYVDIQKALERECPYMLFYKIVLLDEDSQRGRVSMDGRPPSYTSEENEPASMSATGTTPGSKQASTTTLTAPLLARHTSEGSSVISITPGSPIQVPEDGAILLQPPGMDAPSAPEPRRQTTAAVEASAIQPLEVGSNADEPRPRSATAELRDGNTIANESETAVTQTEVGVKDSNQHSIAAALNTAKSGSNRSRPGSGSGERVNGGLSRLSSIFRPRSASKERRPSADVAAVTVVGPAASTLGGDGAGPGTTGTNATAPISGNGGVADAANSEALYRNPAVPVMTTIDQEAAEPNAKPEGGLAGIVSGKTSVDETRLFRGKHKDKDKEKERRRLDRSSGTRRRVRGDRPDRECVVM